MKNSLSTEEVVVINQEVCPDEKVAPQVELKKNFIPSVDVFEGVKMNVKSRFPWGWKRNPNFFSLKITRRFVAGIFLL